MSVRRLVLAVGLLVSTSFYSAQAEDASTGENPDPVFVFNRICYAQVPNLEAIRNMALKLAWRSMSKEDLNEFNSYEDPTALQGWDVQVGERLFRVGITQAPISGKLKENFPEFNGGTATSCSLVLDDQQEASVFMPNMQTLAAKEPVSRDVSDGLLRTTTWAGGNEDLKVFLFAKAPPTGKGGLLNVTVIQK